jgi:hypothetical protein
MSLMPATFSRPAVPQGRRVEIQHLRFEDLAVYAEDEIVLLHGGPLPARKAVIVRNTVSDCLPAVKCRLVERLMDKRNDDVNALLDGRQVST